MDKKLYELMDWPRIEGVVYSEEPAPHEMLGPHRVRQGILIQTFVPNAKKIIVKTLADGKEFPMECVDESYFAVLLSKKRKIPQYKYIIQYNDGKKEEKYDPYAFLPTIESSDLKDYNLDWDDSLIKKLGAYETEIDKVKGIQFVVWVPNALRVSVVGDFNNMDGRIHQMSKLDQTGVYTIFIPELEEDKISYCYEIKKIGNEVYLKLDPFSTKVNLENNRSEIENETFEWNDSKWLEDSKSKNCFEYPIKLLEINLENWAEEYISDKKGFTYENFTKSILKYVVKNGYSHILLKNIIGLDSFGGDFLFASNQFYGTAFELKKFINEMHLNNIGVLLDYNIVDFSHHYLGLEKYDGEFIYEMKDEKNRINGENNRNLFDLSKAEVKSYLLSNTKFWIEQFHIDGFRVVSLTAQLYLDYYKSEGAWNSNHEGGKENLAGIEFFKFWNDKVKEYRSDCITIAGDSSLWPGITSKEKYNSLGFDFKQNIGWSNEFLHYLSLESYHRSDFYEELTASFLYCFGENYMLYLPEIQKMEEIIPGDEERKKATLRLALGYMTVYPGWKIYGQVHPEKEMQVYMGELLSLYENEAALSKSEGFAEGFSWIGHMSSVNNILIFLRKDVKNGEKLLVVCNFSNQVFAKYQIGVPDSGKYKEIFNSDEEKYGGIGIKNSKMIVSEEVYSNGFEQSIVIKIPPLSLLVLKKQ